MQATHTELRPDPGRQLRMDRRHPSSNSFDMADGPHLVHRFFQGRLGADSELRPGMLSPD